MRDPIFKLARVLLLCAGLAATTTLFSACQTTEPGQEVSLFNINRDEKHIPDLPRKDALRIAVASMITPKETIDVYQQIVDYLGEELGRPVELIQRKTYAEVNDLLRQHLTDIAFVCTQAYVEGNRDFGLELVAAPVVRGQAVYYSYLIVPLDSPARELKDLRGKSFAFTDPLSASGRLVPTYLLAREGETPESFFSNYVFTYAHSNSITAVARRIVEGAAVDSLVWDYADATNPKFTSRTKIIYRSEAIGSPPVVVHPDLEPGLKARLKTALLSMNETKQGEDILSKAMIDRFVIGDDRAYDVVRQMLDSLDKNRGSQSTLPTGR
ncbi:MAG: phosphate/phosphite/phosphonate ABC transporter substrate-binding protein [Dehalococcoidia bacterium]|nr:phosphate/phosphite/phosphonate ABC transporter substrate-binding protein [Dehalococcoidia bacterium]